MSEDFQQSPYYFTMADTVYFFANVLMSTFLHRLTVKISSHHIETTDAGLDGLCIREITVYHTTL